MSDDIQAEYMLTKHIADLNRGRNMSGGMEEEARLERDRIAITHQPKSALKAQVEHDTAATNNLILKIEMERKQNELNEQSALKAQVDGDHYKKMKIQPVEFIHANGIPFIEGCVIKYMARWRGKGGIKDLEKAKHFIDLLIELESK